MRLLNSVKSLYAAVGILFLTLSIGSYVDTKNEGMHARHLAINTGLERMVRLNQELTNMLLIAVLEHNPLRAASYDSVNNDLEQTIKTVVDLTKEENLYQEIAALSEGHGRLHAIEGNVIELMSADKWDKAKGVLFGDEYVLAKKTYEIDCETAVSAVMGELAKTAQRFRTIRMAAFGARIGALFLLLCIGIMYSRRTRADLSEQMRLQSEITVAYEEMEERVRERTADLEESTKHLALENEERLRSEARTRLILNSAGEGIFGVDKEGRVTFFNAAAEKLLGFSADEVIGKEIHGMIHHSHADGSPYPPEDCPMFYARTRGEEQRVVDEMLWRKDGSKFLSEYSATPITDDQGDAAGAVIAFHDITERKEAEEQVNAYFNNSSDGLLILSPERGFIHANQTAVVMFGFKSIADLIKCGPVELSPPYQSDGRPSQEAAMEYITKAMQMDVPLRFDWIHRRTDGTEFPCEIALFKIVLAGQQHLITNIRDITERKQMEQKIIAEGERLKKILDTAPVSIAFSTRGIIHFANPLFVETFGAKLGEPSPQIYVHKEERDALVERIARGEIVKDFEIQMFNSRKEVRDMLITYMPIEYEGEDGILGWMTDITERKAAEEAVLLAERRSRTILDAISAGTIIIDPETRKIEDINHVAARMIGLPKEEIIGRICHKFICPREEHECPIIDHGQTVDNAERILMTAEGKTIPVLKTATPITLGNKSYLLESFVDISDQKAMEETVRESQQRLSLLVKSSPLGVIEWNLEFRVTAWNPAAQEIFGFSQEESLGQHASFIVPKPYRENVDAVWQALLEQRGGNHSLNENVRKNGEMIICEWFNTPLVAPDGKVIGVASLVTDITERRRMEEALQESMQEMERFNRLTIDREIRMIELKEEVNLLLAEMSKEQKYKIVE